MRAAKKVVHSLRISWKDRQIPGTAGKSKLLGHSICHFALRRKEEDTPAASLRARKHGSQKIAQTARGYRGDRLEAIKLTLLLNDASANTPNLRHITVSRPL